MILYGSSSSIHEVYSRNVILQISDDDADVLDAAIRKAHALVALSREATAPLSRGATPNSPPNFVWNDPILSRDIF